MLCYPLTQLCAQNPIRRWLVCPQNEQKLYFTEALFLLYLIQFTIPAVYTLKCLVVQPDSSDLGFLWPMADVVPKASPAEKFITQTSMSWWYVRAFLFSFVNNFIHCNVFWMRAYSIKLIWKYDFFNSLKNL